MVGEAVAAVGVHQQLGARGLAGQAFGVIVGGTRRSRPAATSSGRVIRAAASSRVKAAARSRASAGLPAPERCWKVVLVCAGSMSQSRSHRYGPASATVARTRGS